MPEIDIPRMPTFDQCNSQNYTMSDKKMGDLQTPIKRRENLQPLCVENLSLNRLRVNATLVVDA